DWQAWLGAVAAAGLDAVVIADHNTALGIEHVQRAQEAQPPPPIIFPGLELTASDGTHLLVAMDPGCTHEHVEELLTLAQVPVDMRGIHEARSPLSVEVLLTLRLKRGCVFIAAHANKERGLLEHDGMERITELNLPSLAAVELTPVTNPDTSWIDGSRPEVARVIPVVLGSDAHSVAEVGRKFTWVKMSSPTLEGLRLALLDGQASLMPASAADQLDPNRHAALAIESITVASAKYMGSPHEFEVTFNPWLNAVIGSRGTGKSTLVDLCRLVLRREDELGEATDGSLRQAFDRRMQVSASRRDEGLLRADTIVSLVYRKDGQRYRLGWDPSGSVEPINHIEGESLAPEAGEIRERFPVRIYSQKQLFEIAQNPSAMLGLIDESPEVGAVDIRRRLQESETRYLSLRSDARALRARAASLPARLAELADIGRKVETLSTGDHAAVFAAYAARQRQDGEWTSALRAAATAIEHVGEVAVELTVADLDLRTDLTTDEPAAALARSHRQARMIVDELNSQVMVKLAAASAALDALESGEDTQAWRADLDAVAKAYEDAVQTLAEQGITDPREYRDLLQRSSTLTSEIADLRGRLEEADRREAEALEALAAYRHGHAELTSRRSSFCRAQSSDELRMSLQLVDHDSFIRAAVSYLRTSLGFEHFERDFEAIAGKIVGPEGEEWSFGRLEAVVESLGSSASGDGVGDWLDQRFGGALARVAPERLDRLHLFLPDETVELERRDNGSWRSLAQGSPGQQTAALLAFVLGYGDEPIILDQPEDDLDSTLIYDVVVQRLRDSKARRQIIVVTHNANIVVHGDAELITVLGSHGGQTKLEFHGGLQETDARFQICRVLEGGRLAFETRYRRILEGVRDV
ncbi:MAG: TrlF family AAA-like ATPase, partial [Chloroflexota bacterium]